MEKAPPHTLHLVVDTNVLIAECFRKRGERFLGGSRIELLSTERVDSELHHELQRRLEHLVARKVVTVPEAGALGTAALTVHAANVAVEAQDAYVHFEAQARARIPTDPDDWPSMALALATDTGLWTGDRDFFGCGLAVWRTAVLYAELDRLGS